ncbi:MAG TPA: hypothetical protein GXX36_15850 [Clostridiaceae bacterium]|nr:hypothetical protein [Clostridiaceae bacterium]
MKNTTIGKIGSAITGLAVLAFAISMLVGLFSDTLFVSCLVSIFIAIGFLPFMIALYSLNEDKDKKASGIAGIGFAIVYAVLIFIVYYAECTTVRINTGLSKEILSIISFGYTGSLFFNYDLLGYAFMALATFFVGSGMNVDDKLDKFLKALLMIHGIFFIGCFFIPMFPLFSAETSSIVGTIILEIWCIYFLPVCVLGYRYFNKHEK